MINSDFYNSFTHQHLLKKSNSKDSISNYSSMNSSAYTFLDLESNKKRDILNKFLTNTCWEYEDYKDIKGRAV